MKPFNLSDKRHRNAYEDSNDLDWLYNEEDVKEFIRLLKEECENLESFCEVNWMKQQIDSFAGDDLI